MAASLAACVSEMHAYGFCTADLAPLCPDTVYHFRDEIGRSRFVLMPCMHLKAVGAAPQCVCTPPEEAEDVRRATGGHTFAGDVWRVAAVAAFAMAGACSSLDVAHQGYLPGQRRRWQREYLLLQVLTAQQALPGDQALSGWVVSTLRVRAAALDALDAVPWTRSHCAVLHEHDLICAVLLASRPACISTLAYSCLHLHDCILMLASPRSHTHACISTLAYSWCTILAAPCQPSLQWHANCAARLSALARFRTALPGADVTAWVLCHTACELVSVCALCVYALCTLPPVPASQLLCAGSSQD